MPVVKDKVVINYKQVAAKEGAQGESLAWGGKDTSVSGRKAHRYLHDNRMRDSLIEYMENLEDQL